MAMGRKVEMKSSFPEISLITLSSVFVMQAAVAGEWTITPNVSLSQVFTDNVLQNDNDKRSDMLTRVTPSVSVRGEARRLTLELDYQIESQYSAKDSDRTQNTQQLTSAGQIELYDRAFFVDFNANVSQQANNNNDNGVNDNFVDENNADDVYTYKISPFFRHHFGPWLDSEARVSYDAVENVSDAVADSHAVGTALTLTSGDRFPGLPWELAYKANKTFTDDADSTSTSDINLRTRYLWNQSYESFLDLGYEDNDNVNNEEDIDNKGGTWALGMIWTPSNRTTLEASFGEQLFGNSFDFSLEHEGRRSVWSAKYNEKVTNSRTEQLELVALNIDNPDVNEAPSVFVELPTLVDEEFLSKRFTLGMSLETRRSDLKVELFHESRSFQIVTNDETVFGAEFSIERQLSSATSATLATSFEQTQFRDEVNDGEEQTWDIDLSMTRQLTAKSSASVRYRHVVRSADDNNDDFTENNLSLSWQLDL
jgi:uncharacterized protein (PEP-CTERM system associated)